MRELDLAAAGYLAGWRLIRLLPENVANALFRFGADKASSNGKGMEQLRKNLARVVGQENVTKTLVRDSVRSYARYWQEAFRLPSLLGNEAFFERILDGIEGDEHLVKSLKRGKGVVLALPHSGNWDMAGTMLLTYYTDAFTTVAERLKPEVLFQAFVDYRETLGFEVLPLTGGKPPFPILEDRLEAGQVVCLLGERDLKGKGEKVLFFGEETTMPVGSVELALKTGAPLHTVHCWFTDDGWGFSVSPEIVPSTLPEMMQEVADNFAAGISAHPEDWHMLQTLWPSDLRRKDKKTGRQKP